MTKQKAFTLVELMVVIAIIAILAVGTSSLYDSYINKARLKAGLELEREVNNALGPNIVFRSDLANAAGQFTFVGSPTFEADDAV